jgi:hypothetical protein
LVKSRSFLLHPFKYFILLVLHRATVSVKRFEPSAHKKSGPVARFPFLAWSTLRLSP